MRKLMWFSIGFAASCALCAYGIVNQNGILSAAITLLVLFLIGWVFVRGKGWIHCVAVVFLGCSIGLFWFQGFYAWYLSPLDALVFSESEQEILASDYGIETDYGTQVDGILMQNGKPYQIRVYLEEQSSIRPGDRISGNFSIQYVKQEASDYFNGKGIFLFAYEKSPVLISSAEDIPLWCYPSILRQQIRTVLDDLFPSDVAPFARALLLGDSSALDYAADTALKISGIRHIVAVSGLHISILYGLISFVTLRRRFLTAAVAMPVLLLLAAIAGCTPSVIRACIMVWLMLFATLLDKEYDPPTALAFSVLMMLMVNPMAVMSVSLQMSSMCVAGILLFHAPIHNWLKSNFPSKLLPAKLQKTVCSSISVTLSAMSLVTPLSALHFETVSMIGVLTNILTLWVVQFIFYGLILFCLLWWLIPSAISVLTFILTLPMRYVLIAAKILSAVPLSAIFTKSIYVVIWLWFVYILLAAFLLQKKKQPVILFCCSVLGLCCALLASWWEPMMDSSRVTMLDVGQGQSILLQSEGKTFLVDCGGDDDAQTADIIAETLLSQGISRLDGIVLTHYDSDHSGALQKLLTRIDTKLLILPDTRNTFSIPETDTEILWVWDDTELTFGKSRMAIYGPVYSGLDNENSLCVLFDTEKCDILITGDRSSFGERMLVRNADLPDVDILVAGHHGAADSTSMELLQTVQPETVLISVKENNFYGHPSERLLERLNRFGCAVFRTDRHGTITIRR